MPNESSKKVQTINSDPVGTTKAQKKVNRNVLNQWMVKVLKCWMILEQLFTPMLKFKRNRCDRRKRDKYPCWNRRMRGSSNGLRNHINILERTNILLEKKNKSIL